MVKCEKASSDPNKRGNVNITDAGFCGDYCCKYPNYSAECQGCAPEKHEDCHFVQCCLEREIEHCGFCSDFPCMRLIQFCPDDRPGCPQGYHIDNLRARAKMGTIAWLEAQQERWPSEKEPRG